MSGWDQGQVFHANLLASQPPDISTSSTELLKRCINFFENYRTAANVFIYRNEIMAAVNTQAFLVTLNIAHIQAFDEELMNELLTNPQETVLQLEEAVRHVSQSILGTIPATGNNLKDPLSTVQVQLIAPGTQTMSLRSLDAANVSKFVRIPGIVVSTASIVSRPVRACVRCRACGTQTTVNINSSFGMVQLPPQCPGPQGSLRTGTNDVAQARCPRDSFFILPEQSLCVDQQSLKLQEAPDAVPVGELPRHALLVVDRSLVNKVTAGTRVIVNGFYSIMMTASSSAAASKGNGGAPAIRTPYIRVLGIEADESGVALHGGRHRTSTPVWSEEEEAEMRAFSQQPDLYERFARSIAPPIFGCDDIKKALACLLMGGSKRILPDGLRLRGDINVLLLGDPGTAKSQFLKFIERVAPVAVYTSGKGSSAAGLTASVIRDPSSGDFYLEGGAMVLADGGVVCIDEFDKMDDEDRVAIHEAMEQQTISIAKAGITTVLNSRSSVLAAANPVFGRYDETRTPGENIDFSTTILSRFDMIFLVKDEHDMQRDQTLARHVLSVHQNANSTDSFNRDSGEFDLITMKRYISFCRSKCAPRLSEEAAERLGNFYIEMRERVYEKYSTSSSNNAVPITVRQLEAIIRIAEALAKLTLSTQATVHHVDEAVRLFKASTMQAVLAGHSLEGMARPDLIGQIDVIEKTIKARLPVGSIVGYRQLVDELVTSKGFQEPAVVKAIDALCRQERLMWRSQRRMLLRQQ